MSKRYDDPIEVILDAVNRAAPVAFRWRGRRYEIDKRLGAWREVRAYNGAPDLTFVRVLARPAGSLATGDLDADGFMPQVGAVYDLCLDAAAWRLKRVWD